MNNVIVMSENTNRLKVNQRDETRFSSDRLDIR